MFSTAEKSKNVNLARKQVGNATFFRKAADEKFFGTKENPSFFNSQVQAKLQVSQADDPFEKEADLVSEKVMRMPEPALAITSKKEEEKLQRKEEKEEEKEETQPKLFAPQVPVLQRKEDSTDFSEQGDTEAKEENEETISRKASTNLYQGFNGQPSSSKAFLQNLNSLNGSGSVLPDPAKAFMENRFNADFSDVRIHTSSNAELLSSAIHAQAFTHKNNIYFNTGKFSPYTTTGGLLLAHELTHVLQQKEQGLHYNYSNKLSNQESNTGNTPPVIPFERSVDSTPSPALPEPKAEENQPQAIPKTEVELPPAVAEAKPVSSPGAPLAEQAVEIPKAPTSPATDPAFKIAKKQVYSESKRQKHHVPASDKKEDTVNASAMTPEDQRAQDSVEKSTKEMEQTGANQQAQGKSFDAQKFKDDLKKRIEEKKPTTESKAKEMAKNPPVQHFETEFSQGVASEQGKVTGPLEKKAAEAPSGGKEQKTEIPLPKPVIPGIPKKVDAKLAIPKSKTDQEISLQHESDKIDGAMEENKLSDDQLAESREPSFIETLQVKQEAKQKIAEAPAAYRQQEAEILQKAELQTDGELSQELTAMNKSHHKSGKNIFGNQEKTETATEKRQKEIKGTIDGIYKDTVTSVKGILEAMTLKVKTDFSNSLKNQTETFNANVKSRISDYYGDWRIDDAIFGPDPVIVNEDGSTRAMTLQEKFGGTAKETINPQVYRIFVQEKDNFLKEMDKRLDSIAKDVENGLTAAHNMIVFGEQRIKTFKLTLSAEEQIYATQLEDEVKLKFQSLEDSIDDTREDLLQTMADEYSEHVNQLEKTFKDINDELKKSWIDRAIEFVKTVGKTIFQLAELLLSILVRVAYLVWDIIKHPIRFFETLVSGLKQGISMFVNDIGTYMQEAFWTWISGATPGKNIKISPAGGVMGLFDVVLQILNLGPDALRAIIEKRLGKEFMQMVDQGIAFGEKILEPVIILLTKGPLAFWEYIKDTLSEIIQSSFDRIKETVFYAFIENGLKYIAGFFIPGGGFVKIIKAIVKAFQFVAENLENLKNFFDSIFDAMDAAVTGVTEGVASKVLTGLKIAMVLALDFLAKILGLDKIIDQVQKIIQAIRKPIVAALDFILIKAKPLVMKLMRKGKEAIAKVKKKAGAVAGKVLNFLGIKKGFRDKDGESHQLYFKGTDKNPQLILASDPVHIGNWVTKRKQELQAEGKLNPNMIDLFQRVQKLMQEIKTLTYDDGKAKRKPEDVINELAQVIAKIGVSGDHPVPRMLVQPGFSSAKANGLTVQYLFNDKNNHQPGDPSDGKGDLHGAFTELSDLGVKRQWDRGHLLNAEFGGLAVNSNLVPMPKAINLGPYKGLDRGIREMFLNKKVIWVKIDLDRNHENDPEGRFVSSLNGSAGLMDFDSSAGTWKEGAKEVSLNLDKTQLYRPVKVGQSVYSINDAIKNSLKDRKQVREIARSNGITERLMLALIERGTVINDVAEIQLYIQQRADWKGDRMKRMLATLEYAVTHGQFKLN